MRKLLCPRSSQEVTLIVLLGRKSNLKLLDSQELCLRRVRVSLSRSGPSGQQGGVWGAWCAQGESLPRSESGTSLTVLLITHGIPILVTENGSSEIKEYFLKSPRQQALFLT